MRGWYRIGATGPIRLSGRGIGCLSSREALFLRRVIHPEAHDNYRVILKDGGEEIEMGSRGGRSHSLEVGVETATDQGHFRLRRRTRLQDGVAVDSSSSNLDAKLSIGTQC